MKVLIIDDSDLARAHLRSLLGKAGIESHELPSAIGATRAILEHAIDVVLIDVSMPGLSGDKLVGVLRNNRRLDHVYAILVSSKPLQELDSIAQAAGADAVISKHEVEAGLVALLRTRCAAPRPRTSCEK